MFGHMFKFDFMCLSKPYAFILEVMFAWQIFYCIVFRDMDDRTHTFIQCDERK